MISRHKKYPLSAIIASYIHLFCGEKYWYHQHHVIKMENFSLVEIFSGKKKKKKRPRVFFVRNFQRRNRVIDHYRWLYVCFAQDSCDSNKLQHNCKHYIMVFPGVSFFIIKLYTYDAYLHHVSQYSSRILLYNSNLCSVSHQRNIFSLLTTLMVV